MAEQAATAPTAAPTNPSDADLVADILSNQSANEPANAVADGEEQASDGEGTEAEETDDSHDGEDSTEDDEAAEPSKVAGPLKAALAQVRKALEAGDLDPKELGLTNKDWTAFRKATSVERQKVQGERVQLQQWQQNAQAQLNTAINQLAPLEPWYLAEQSFNRDGDVGHFIKVIEERTKLTYDEFQKLALSKAKLSPEVRRIREEAERTKAELAALKAKLEQPPAPDPEAVKRADMAHIQTALASHEVAKIPNFVARVYNVLAKTANHLGATMSVEDAAQRVIRGEQRRLEKSPYYKKPEAAAEPAGKKGKRPVLRKDSKSEGANPSKDETTDSIVDDLLRKHKVANAAVGR